MVREELELLLLERREAERLGRLIKKPDDLALRLRA
jgi:hypothetical protein